MLQESVRHSLEKLLPKGQVFTDRATLISYEVDAGLDKGIPEGVVFPRTISEVQQVAKWAAQHNIPLVARGAGTGLSGGAVADRGGIIVEFVHMNRILDFDPLGRSAVVEPALINLRLDERAKTHGLYFPPDPSSQRASTMGGNVAENSGGPHCFKYGVTTNYVLGMDVVLADGRHLRLGGRALDYPEYDLTGLVTGSEGMLALISSIFVRLLRNPPGVKTLLAIFDSVEQAGTAVSAVIAAGLVPATMEMMDNKIVQIIEPFAQANLPLDAGAVLIIEFDGYPESLDRQLAEVNSILESHGGHDMRIARDDEERNKIWLARKSAAGAIAREVPAQYTVDITVPRSRLAETLAEVNEICDKYRIRAGHVFHAGDGNLHPLVLISDPDDRDLIARVHAAGREMVACCVKKDGSLTGEHGVGIEKRQFMTLMHKPEELMAMWDIKEVFDPQGLLNPGKVFPRPENGEDMPFMGYTREHDLPIVHENGKTVTKKFFSPTSAEEAALQLRQLSLAKQPVMITSSRQQREDHKVLMSTSGLRGIKTYAPEDLYITVEAGTPLTELQSYLAGQGKRLAVSSPWLEDTIGDVVAKNLNAPLRMRYGAIRDNVLCATVALADGRVIRTGRPIMKNVAGYDLTKVFVGSHGTLGLLTDITLKVVATPRVQKTLFLPVRNIADGLRYGQQMLNLALNASAIVLCEGSRQEGVSDSDYLLAYTAEGTQEDVEAELQQVRRALEMLNAPVPSESNSETGIDLWNMWLSQAIHCNETLVRVGLPVKNLAGYVEKQISHLNAGSFMIDFANGFIYARRPEVELEQVRAWLVALRKPALIENGYAVVMDAPPTVLPHLDRWGYQPGSIEVMKTLKMRWDPYSILNPDAFVL